MKTSLDARMHAKPLDEMRPMLLRGQANYVRVMNRMADAVEKLFRQGRRAG